MDEDIRRPNWGNKALARWALYTLVWGGTVGLGCVSGFHVVLEIGTCFLGVLLAIALLMLFYTLFEHTLASKDAFGSYAPLSLTAFCGVPVILIGTVLLIQAAPLMSSQISAIRVSTPQELQDMFAGAERKELPVTVCLDSAFVKTDWEAGKLICEQAPPGAKGASVICRPEFMAAPIFNNKKRADLHDAAAVHAWAVAKGVHVDANYRPDGSLCGYMTGDSLLDFYINDYRQAVERVIQKYELHLMAAVSDESPIPLEERPFLMLQDPLEVTAKNQVFLTASLIFLFMCPCAGPVPLGLLLIYFCYRRSRRRQAGPGRLTDWPNDDGERGITFDDIE